MKESKTRCGYVAIVGQPNVGKSTLLNHLLGMKISITSRKPQTTRHNVLGIKTEANSQLIFVDTPGIHAERKKAINRIMNRAAQSAIRDVDVIVFVTDGLQWNEADQLVAQQISGVDTPVIIAINKIDRLESSDVLLPLLETLHQILPAAELIPVSALRSKNLDVLEQAISRHIPIGEYLFPADQITDRSERFLAAEIVREKITRQMGAELPYQVTVEIEEFADRGNIRHISALILVERSGQKKIVIGSNGARLKTIGQQARLDMERMFGCKVMLKLWVKVRSGWSDDERALRSLGYTD
ncbi:MAG: GTPase Era [Gammaproteobacteria bacterium]|nr:MAG: GTPase Era [Gammaproteobacteria bacterium]RLA54813.1 MAG: GTPase Era [Gammaproteobacteria bacterium]